MSKTLFRDPGSPSRCVPARTLVLALAMSLVSLPAGAASASRKYKLEKNKELALELSAGGIRVDTVLFEFPSSVLRFQTATKARVTVTNTSGGAYRVGLAIALHDAEGNLVGAGTGGNKGGRVDAGETTEFSVFFYYVNEQIAAASSFQITLEVN